MCICNSRHPNPKHNCQSYLKSYHPASQGFWNSLGVVFEESGEGHGRGWLEPVAGVPVGVVTLDDVEGVDVTGLGGRVPRTLVVHLSVDQYQRTCGEKEGGTSEILSCVKDKKKVLHFRKQASCLKGVMSHKDGK